MVRLDNTSTVCQGADLGDQANAQANYSSTTGTQHCARLANTCLVPSRSATADCSEDAPDTVSLIAAQRGIGRYQLPGRSSVVSTGTETERENRTMNNATIEALRHCMGLLDPDNFNDMVRHAELQRLINMLEALDHPVKMLWPRSVAAKS